MCTNQYKLTDTPTVDGIPPADNDPGHEVVLVLVANSPHQMRRDLDGRHSSRFDGELGQVVLDVVGDGLRVGGTSGAAAPDPIVELGDLIGRAVGHVRAGGDAGVGPEDDAAGEGDGHDGGSGGDFARSEVARFGRFAVVAGSGGTRGGTTHHGSVEGTHWTRRYREAKQSTSTGISSKERPRRLWSLDEKEENWSRFTLVGTTFPGSHDTGSQLVVLIDLPAFRMIEDRSPFSALFPRMNAKPCFIRSESS